MRFEGKFAEPLCGGVPRNDDVVKTWIQTRTATDASHRKALEVGTKRQTLGEVEKEKLATIDPLDPDEEMSKIWVGFSKDEKGLFIRGANVRAHLKDCASVIGQQIKSELKNFRSKFIDRVYILENRLRIEKDGKTLTTAPEYRDATCQVMTPLGPRTCLKRVDMVPPPCILRATIQLLPGNSINRDAIVACLEYGKVHGFGQDRSLQFGRYEYKLGE
jgi:hypothetical protein